MNRFGLWGFSAVLHAYIGLRLVPDLGRAGLGLEGSVALSLLAWLVASAVLIPLGLIGRRAQPGTWRGAITLAGLFMMGAFSSLFVLTLVRDIVLLPLALWRVWQPAALPWSALTTYSALAVPALAATATLIGLYLARRRTPVVRVDVPIEGLPAQLDGFAIAQITDLHVGPTIRAPYVQTVVDAVNGLQADLIAVTGDLVDGSVADLAPQVAPLAALRSRHGTFFVTGNHEYYSGAHAWIAELRRLGFNVLLNQHVVLQHDGAALLVAGVTDVSAHHFDPAHRSDPVQSLRSAPDHVWMRVLLAHQPRSADAAQSAGFQLQLSGHTHGGQFLPWNFFVRLQQPFTAGLQRLRGMWVYISRGTGYWGPPNRFGVSSEITLLRLVATPVTANS